MANEQEVAKQKQVETVMNKKIDDNIKRIIECFNICNNVLKIVAGADKFLADASLPTYDKVRALMNARAEKDVVAEYISKYLIYLSENKKVFPPRLSKLAADANALIKKLTVPSYVEEIEFRDMPIAQELKQVAENFEAMLDILAYFKYVLTDYCKKPNLAQAVDNIYLEVKNQLVPDLYKLSTECEKFFDTYSNKQKAKASLADPKVKLDAKTIKSADVKQDDYSC